MKPNTLGKHIGLKPRNRLVPVARFRKAGVHKRSLRSIHRDDIKINKIEEQQ